MADQVAGLRPIRDRARAVAHRRLKGTQLKAHRGAPATPQGVAAKDQVAKETSMRQRTVITLIALAIALTGLALVKVVAQSKPAPVLTAMDYVQIKQLVTRYAYAL